MITRSAGADTLELQPTLPSKRALLAAPTPPAPQTLAARTPARRLELERPLVALDLETTGLGADAEIVEIALVELRPNGSKRVLMDALVRPLGEVSPGAERVHHHSTDSLKDCDTFAEIAPQVLTLLQNCDVVGHNIKTFDMRVLRREFERVNMEVPEDMQVVDTYDLFKHCVTDTPDHKLATAYRYYCHKDLEGAHNALPDTRAALDIVQAMVARHRELPTTVDELSLIKRGRSRTSRVIDARDP